MSSKINWNKTFILREGESVECGWQNTRYGFRHLAVLRDGYTRVEAKVCYYNRTWESYTYQTVLHKVIDKKYPEDIAKTYKNKVDAEAKQDCEGMFKSIKALALFSDLMGTTPSEKNQLKKRVLSTVPGIDFPDNWESLPEDEKSKRIDGALKIL